MGEQRESEEEKTPTSPPLSIRFAYFTSALEKWCPLKFLLNRLSFSMVELECCCKQKVWAINTFRLFVSLSQSKNTVVRPLTHLLQLLIPPSDNSRNFRFHQKLYKRPWPYPICYSSPKSSFTVLPNNTHPLNSSLLFSTLPPKLQSQWPLTPPPSEPPGPSTSAAPPNLALTRLSLATTTSTVSPT